MRRMGDRVFSGAPWEKQVGYCRAIKVGHQIWVSGTAPVAEDGSVYAPGEPYWQAKRCFDLVVAALAKFGAKPEHVVRTRMYVTDAKLWPQFGRAHQETFGAHPPATAMVEVKALIDPAMLIEVEADAVITG